MAKNILIFADGTGNVGGLLPDETRSNVYKLFRATRSGPDTTTDPAQQVAFYIAGIGTLTAGHNSRWERIWVIVQQMFGCGLTQKIIDCYVAIISVWQPGDRIYLFGFSRGSYTVRCVAHVLEVCGIPRREPGSDALNFKPKRLRAIAKAAVRTLYWWSLVEKDDDKRQQRIDAFCKTYGSHIGPDVGALPYFIGVWDSVSAMGWARFCNVSPDVHFPSGVRFARHAMSIDEYRKDFKRVGWGGSGTVRAPKSEDEPAQFEQIWFAGNHADIGGSYPENESRLSDITLSWMADFISNKLPADAQVSIDRRFLSLFPSSDGMMHDEFMVGVGGTPLRWYPGDRDVPTDAILHETVYQRLRMDSVRNYTSFGKYRPAPLRNHHQARQFFEADSAG